MLCSEFKTSEFEARIDGGKGGSEEKRQGRGRAIEVGGRNEKKRERDKQYINKNVRDGVV